MLFNYLYVKLYLLKIYLDIYSHENDVFLILFYAYIFHDIIAFIACKIYADEYKFKKYSNMIKYRYFFRVI